MSVAEAEVECALRTELEPGEHLLWSARPARGLRLRFEDAQAIPFSLFCCWPLLRWTNALLSSDLPASVQFVMATPLVLLALFLLIGRFFFDAKLRAKTYYGLTQRRILVVSEAFVRKVKGLDLRDLGPSGLELSRRGFGTVRFGWPETSRHWRSRRRRPQLQLEMIADAETAHQRICAARQARCART